MSESRLKHSPPDNLRKVWPYIDWLDRTRHSISTNEALIPGPVFTRLEPSKKILTHWLCYAMDAQMDYRRLWALGGPVIAELVEEYSRGGRPLKVLAGFAPGPARTGKVATLKPEKQYAGGDDILEITPRYSWMLFSIAVTLLTLDHFGRSLTAYLSRHETFLLSRGFVQIPARMAFLLYLLTYSDIPQKNRHLRSKSFSASVARRSKKTMKLLKSASDLEKEFQRWYRSKKRFHKRLWAAVRDYLKNEGFEFYEHFQDAFSKNNFKTLADRIAHNQSAILVGLEVPGDVYNLRFFRRLFREDIEPRQLRSWFDGLREDGRLPENAAVERFDISFRYSPKMCDERRERCCVFREKSDIWDYCPPRRGIDWRGSRCPVTDHLCGIEYACDPNGCPVRQGVPANLCQGCRVNIREKPIEVRS